MASHNTLRNADIGDMIPGEMPMDGIALWSNILAECGYDGHGDESNDDGMTQNDDEHLTREMIISARLCEDEYFYSSYVRTDEWKVLSLCTFCVYFQSFCIMSNFNLIHFVFYVHFR